MSYPPSGYPYQTDNGQGASPLSVSVILILTLVVNYPDSRPQPGTTHRSI
jgi:hypothetical protein